MHAEKTKQSWRKEIGIHAHTQFRTSIIVANSTKTYLTQHNPIDLNGSNPDKASNKLSNTNELWGTSNEQASDDKSLMMSTEKPKNLQP